MPWEGTLTRKGQVTVPVRIRRKLGLRAGDRVEFTEKGNEAVIRRAPNKESPFARYKGAFPGLGKDVRAINAWVADLRDDKERD